MPPFLPACLWHHGKRCEEPQAHAYGLCVGSLLCRRWCRKPHLGSTALQLSASPLPDRLPARITPGRKDRPSSSLISLSQRPGDVGALYQQAAAGCVLCRARRVVCTASEECTQVAHVPKVKIQHGHLCSSHLHSARRQLSTASPSEPERCKTQISSSQMLLRKSQTSGWDLGSTQFLRDSLYLSVCSVFGV